MNEKLSALGLLTLVASIGTAHAATVTTTGTQAITATTAVSNNGNSGAAQTKSATVQLQSASFDNSLGVLTGVSATLSGGELAAGGSAAGLRQGHATYSLAGASTSTPVLSVTSGSASFAAQSLNSFANLASFVTQGAGTVTGQAGYSVTADRTAASGATNATVQGTASQSITYTYLQHANASFSAGSDLDLTSLTASTAGTGFSVFALAGALGVAETTRLDAVGVQCVSGNCGAFSLDLATFQDLVAGGQVAGSVKLLASAVGSYTSQWALTFSDDTALGVGQRQNVLSLTVNGNVSPVPEPGTHALLAGGLLAVAFVARRRRR